MNEFSDCGAVLLFITPMLRRGSTVGIIGVENNFREIGSDGSILGRDAIFWCQRRYFIQTLRDLGWNRGRDAKKPRPIALPTLLQFS